MEEDTGKSLHVGGATGRIHGADYSLVDYNRAGIPLIEIVTKPVAGTGRARARGRQGVRRRRCATCCARSACPTCGWSRARCAATSTCRCAVAPSAARHPHRDQERQLAALGRARRALRDHAGRPAVLDAGEQGRPGDAALPRGHRHHHVRARARRTPRTTATSPSPTSCRSRRPRSGSRSCAPTLPELPAGAPRAAAGRSGGSRDLEHARRRQRRRARPRRGDGRRRRRLAAARASGGSASSRGRRTSAASTSPSCP